jgi:CheY-like chemotaxis protein
MSPVSNTEPMRPAPAQELLALVVEPDVDQRRHVVGQLQQWGYLAVAVATAEEALPLLGRHTFVLSIVALRLPGMSGPEMLRRAPDPTAPPPARSSSGPRRQRTRRSPRRSRPAPTSSAVLMRPTTWSAR